MPVCARVFAGVIVLGVIAAHPARAENDQTTGARFELTPYLGYQLGGSFQFQDTGQHAHVQDHAAFALAFDIRANVAQQYEFFYARQPTEVSAEPTLPRANLDVDYLQFGGTQTFSDDEQFLNPYLIGSAGLTRLSLDAPGASNRTRFSIAVGAGLRIPVRANFDVKLETRVFFTFFSSNTSVFCSSTAAGGACTIIGSGSVFVQYQFLAGAAFAF